MRTIKVAVTQNTNTYERAKASVVDATLYIARPKISHRMSKCSQCGFKTREELCNNHTCNHKRSVIWLEVK